MSRPYRYDTRIGFVNSPPPNLHTGALYDWNRAGSKKYLEKFTIPTSGVRK